MKRISVTRGLVSSTPRTCDRRRSVGRRSAQRNVATRVPRGTARQSGQSGRPSSSSGGATIVSRSCWIMWTQKSLVACWSTTDSSAISTVKRPAKKQSRRQTAMRGPMPRLSE